MMSQEEWEIRSKWLAEDNAWQDQQYQNQIARDDVFAEGRVSGLREALAIIDCIAPTSLPADPRCAYQQAIDAAKGFLEAHIAHVSAREATE